MSIRGDNEAARQPLISASAPARPLDNYSLPFRDPPRRTTSQSEANDENKQRRESTKETQVALRPPPIALPKNQGSTAHKPSQAGNWSGYSYAFTGTPSGGGLGGGCDVSSAAGGGTSSI